MALTLDNSGDWALVDGTVTVTLVRQTSVKDTSGGPRLAWAAVTSCVGDLQSARGTVKERFAQLGLIVEYTLYLSADVGALASDGFRYQDRLFTLVEGGYETDPFRLTGWPATAHVHEIPGGV